jgi:hypothetical protein
MQYYTPKIEEFHVGFKYERQCKIRNETWNKQICDVDLINIAYDAIEHSGEYEPYEEQFRVKVLDEQDILDCEFEYTNNDLDLIKNRDDKIIRIRYRIIDDEPHLRIYEKSNRSYKDEWMPIFIGKIKNKTEFKKLLTQLEIII